MTYRMDRINKLTEMRIKGDVTPDIINGVQKYDDDIELLRKYISRLLDKNGLESLVNSISETYEKNRERAKGFLNDLGSVMILSDEQKDTMLNEMGVLIMARYGMNAYLIDRVIDVLESK